MENQIEHYDMTAVEAANYFGFHVQYLKLLARSKQLPGMRIGTRWRFSKAQLLEHFKNKMLNKSVTNFKK